VEEGVARQPAAATRSVATNKRTERACPVKSWLIG